VEEGRRNPNDEASVAWLRPWTGTKRAGRAGDDEDASCPRSMEGMANNASQSLHQHHESHVKSEVT
jgi:hypothetical protein